MSLSIRFCVDVGLCIQMGPSNVFASHIIASQCVLDKRVIAPPPIPTDQQGGS